MAARYVIGNLCISDGYRKLAGRFTAAVTGLGSSPGLSLGVTQADSESAIFRGGAALVRHAVEPPPGFTVEWSPYGVSRSSFEKLSELDHCPFDLATRTRLIRLSYVLPFAAFAAVAELVRERRPDNPSAYAVAVLNAWHREGRYG